jgi:hypothetical protein
MGASRNQWAAILAGLSAALAGAAPLVTTGLAKMTLIACLHPRQCRTLLADVLISSSDLPDGDVVLPSGAYIPPEQLQAVPRRPAGFRRKVIQITPDLVAVWAGSYDHACQFARRAKTWFAGRSATEEEVISFIEAHYRERVQNFCAIIAPSATDWYFKLGDVVESESSLAGGYAVAGSGSQIFRSRVDRMSPREDDTVAPDLDGLHIANDLLAHEVSTFETLHAAFGAAYEVLYRGANGFERVDDAMHFVTRAKICKNATELSHHPRALRQWYEGDELYVASFSTDAHQHMVVHPVLDVLGEPNQHKRTVESLATRPNYICIRHLFEFEGKQVPSSCVLKGEMIDRYFELSWDGSGVIFCYTAVYQAFLDEQATRVKAHFAHE